MNIYIIAALSADGFIAKDINEPSTKWTSKEDTKHFMERTKRTGVIVMGSKTFETFGSKPLPGRRNIVYSANKQYENVETTKESPYDLLKRLENEGINEVAICGGASIYTMFMEASLIDKLILTIEGVVFGNGVRLFKSRLNFSLKLVSSEQIGPNTVVLEYDIIKK